MNAVFHQIIKLSTQKNYSNFVLDMNSLKDVQLSKIKTNYDFFSRLPITSYQDYKAQFESLKSSRIHLVPTSGSSQSVKWIPYTKAFKKELAMASDPWIQDLYRTFPNIMTGKHYWSLSWVPEEFRTDRNSNDTSLFSFFDKLILNKVMLVSESLSHVETINKLMMLTIIKMFEANLTLISIWSPTFLLELLDFSLKNKTLILDNLSDPFVKSKFNECHEWNSETTKLMFSNLQLISCWQTSSSKFFYDKLKHLFPEVAFQGKGLWATEGVVSIPFHHRHLLAYRSHFYEFLCTHTQKIYPAFSLEKDMEVIPIITTGSGMLRYQMEDRIKVIGFYKDIPEIEFMGRQNVSDLVGEKFDFVTAQKIIDLIHENFGLHGICFVAKINPHPHYEFLIEGNSLDQSQKLEQFIESQLLEIFHYKLARDLGQLGPLKVKWVKNSLNEYMQKLANIKIKGNIKIEPIIKALSYE